MQKEKEKSRTGILPRNKQSHAQFVWIRDVYCRIDEVKERLDRLENRVSDMSVRIALDIAELRGAIEQLKNRKVNKEVDTQSSEEMNAS